MGTTWKDWLVCTDITVYADTSGLSFTDEDWAEPNRDPEDTKCFLKRDYSKKRTLFKFSNPVPDGPVLYGPVSMVQSSMVQSSMVQCLWSSLYGAVLFGPVSIVQSSLVQSLSCSPLWSSPLWSSPHCSLLSLSNLSLSLFWFSVMKDLVLWARPRGARLELLALHVTLLPFAVLFGGHMMSSSNYWMTFVRLDSHPTEREWFCSTDGL